MFLTNGILEQKEQNNVTNGVALHGDDTTTPSMRKLFGFEFIPTRSRDEVPLLFREPHIERGFRELHHPWYYYVLSVFQLHNESMNVWTHLLAASLKASLVWRFSHEVDFLHDPYTWPLLAGLLCGMALYLCSSTAHCMQNKSELVHYVAFMVDYAGIGIYGLGSVILHMTYSSEEHMYKYTTHFHIPLGGAFAFLTLYCCAMSKVMYSRPYPFMRKVWQMTPVGGIYIIIITPIVDRVITCYVAGEECNASIPYHLRQVFWFGLSGVFFSVDFPQRWLPGYFDHFFHSHQLFHLSITMCTMCQMDAVFIDFKTRQDLIHSRPPRP